MGGSGAITTALPPPPPAPPPSDESSEDEVVVFVVAAVSEGAAFATGVLETDTGLEATVFDRGVPDDDFDVDDNGRLRWRRRRRPLLRVAIRDDRRSSRVDMLRRWCGDLPLLGL
jgi:hypothetical protein